MRTQTLRALVVLSVIAAVLAVPACGPKKSKRKELDANASSDRMDELERRASAVSPKGPSFNWREMEGQISNLKSRTEKALELIRDANDLRKKYTAATGAARKDLGKQIDKVYTKASDVYDEILMEVDDIHEKYKVDTNKHGSLLSLGPILGPFSRKWERNSKYIKRMNFR